MKKKHDDQIKALTIENKNVIESIEKIREENEKRIRIIKSRLTVVKSN